MLVIIDTALATKDRVKKDSCMEVNLEDNMVEVNMDNLVVVTRRMKWII